MFLCRTGRPRAAALDQALRSAGSSLAQVTADRPTVVTLTSRRGHTFQRHRCSCVSAAAVESTRVHLGGKQQQPPDSSSGFVTRHWGHLDRVSAIAGNLSDSVQSEGGSSFVIRRHSGGAAERAARVVFTGNCGVSSLRRSAGTTQTRASSTQTRASSTAAATKKSDAGEGQTADNNNNNKGEEQNLKEASTVSSSALKAPGEPEGEKPNKTQQLKKVFKEYGAVGVSFHIGISLMSLGMFYLLISSGIDMAAMLCKLGFSEAVVQSKMAAGTSMFVLAYAIHKLFAPVRISITLVSVPLIVRYFRKTGLFKPPTP